MPTMVLKGLAETFSSISVSESASDMVNSLAELTEWLGGTSYKRLCRHRNPFCVDWLISTDHIALLPIHAQIEHPPFYSIMYFTRNWNLILDSSSALQTMQSISSWLEWPEHHEELEEFYSTRIYPVSHCPWSLSIRPHRLGSSTKLTPHAQCTSQRRNCWNIQQSSMVHKSLQAQGSNFTLPFFVLFHCFIVALCAVSLLNMLGPGYACLGPTLVSIKQRIVRMHSLSSLVRD